MKKGYIIVALAVLIGIGQGGYLGDDAGTGLPIFRIDLETAPYKRFEEPTSHLKDKILTVFQKYMDGIPQFIHTAFEFLHPLLKFWQPVRVEEMEGIASALGVESWKVIMANYAYDISAFCTSIIARKSDGSIIHARNMDYLFPKDMQPITYHVKWYRNDQYLYESV